MKNPTVPMENRPELVAPWSQWDGSSLARQARPFVWVATLYGGVGALVVLGFTPEPYTAFSWFLLFYVLVVANLFFLSKVVAVTLDLMSHQGTEKRLYSTSHLMIYGTAKFAILGGIFLLAWKGNAAPLLAKMTALGGLVGIPLFGGLWISRHLGLER